MVKNKLKYKRVKVIWQDICSSSQWYDDLSDVDDFTFSWCEDIGYLYYKDSKVIKIFSSFSFDGSKLSIGNVTAYPRCVVKKIEYLK
jgi:hypothetical protein|tara:strand:+ start:96 stop:356 length:261 start_codon:yes stop_codon:yes gene_type:complete